MAKSSEMSSFIKTRLGRTSSKLVQSFQRYMSKINGIGGAFLLSWDQAFPDWIKTVRQAPGKRMDHKQVDLNRLYKTIENLSKALEAEKEKCGRLGDRVQLLEKENSKLQAIKNNYIAPPANVLRAMAVHGD
jgi:hypothetical protein